MTFAFFFVFLSGFLLSQNYNSCEILKKSKEIYSNKSYIYKIKYKHFSSVSDDTIRRAGELYFYKKDLHKTPFYKLTIHDSLVFFNNSNYFGLNNTHGNWFADYSQKSRDSTRLLRGNFNHYLFPGFLINKNYFDEFIDSCKSNKISLKQNDKYFTISYIDNTIALDSMGKKQVGKRKLYINVLEIDKSTFLMRKQFREFISELGGVDVIQKEFFEYDYTAIAAKDVLTTIENLKPFPNKPPQPNKKEEVYESLKVFPEFNLKDLKGNSYSDTLIKSRFVLVDFWYKACAPCILNMKELKKIDSLYNKMDLTILAINVRDENLESLNKFIQQFNLNYTVLYEGKSLAEKFHFKEYPQTFIYDNKDKKIVFSDSGGSASYSETLKAVINDLLNK